MHSVRKPAGVAARVCGREQPQRALSRFQIARLPDQVPQALQRERGHTVAGGRGVVETRLGPQDQPLVIVTGEEEAAALAILELRSAARRRARPRSRDRRGGNPPAALEQRRQQEGVIVQIGVQMRPPVLVGREQAAIAPQNRAQKVERPPRRGDPSARSSTRPACSMPWIISAFQEVRILSSRPGRTRCSRAANSLCARAFEHGLRRLLRTARAARPLPRSGCAMRRCQCRPSKFGGLVQTVDARRRPRTLRRRAAPRPPPATRRRTCPPRARSRRRGWSSSRLRAIASRASPSRRSPRTRAQNSGSPVTSQASAYRRSSGPLS